MNIKIKRNDLELEYKRFTFSGGEVSIKLNPTPKFFVQPNAYQAAYQTIIAHVTSSEDFMAVAMIKDALERHALEYYQDLPAVPIRLFIPYFPYARQDRACVKGESFSLKVFADLINHLNFERVTILDPHSGVTPALINNVRVISQLDIIGKWHDLSNRLVGCKLVAPDSGSNKKVSDIAAYFQHQGFVRCDKLRDLSNGNIKETIVYENDLNGCDVAICDDLCDGGRTFTELAKVLKTKNCGKIVLFVTHGIFSKGIDCLLNEGIDEIWTTNSFSEGFLGKNIFTFNVENLFDK